jgi:hypothetical protein
MTDTRTPVYEGSVTVGDRTVHVARGFADLETDAQRLAGLRFWAKVLSGEQRKRKAPLARGQASQDGEV